MSLGRHAIVLVAAALLLLGERARAGGGRIVATVESERAHFVLRELARGLEHPWSLAFLPDGRFLVSERPGRLRYVAADGTLDPEPISGIPEVWARGQGGLLDVALDPEFARNRLVYLSYAAAVPGGAATHVARGRLVDHRLEKVEVIFRSNGVSRTGRHFGSRLLFRDGLLYVTLGERGVRRFAQDLSVHAGSVIRIRPDGSVPEDNPFMGTPGAMPEIFTYGHRNPQGMDRNPATGEVWIHEHGPQGGDEVNRLVAGANYGWPLYTHGREYGTGEPIGLGTEAPGIEPPLWVWIPSIAPSGMAFYGGDAFPGWKGDLLVGALRAQMLVRLDIEDGRIVAEERLLRGLVGRIRDVRVGPDGLVYLLSDAADGGLYRLEPRP